jgi:hypothetical protein
MVLGTLSFVLAMGLAAQAFTLQGSILSPAECQALGGGETYVEVNAERTRATVTSIPRDAKGMDYSRATCYTVPVHNRVTKTPQPSDADFYKAASFPSGSASMDVKKIPDTRRQDRYGSSGGEWITTDASRTVTAYPRGADGKADLSQPTTRQDYGYFWHANNAVAYDRSESAGCLISPKADLDRVIATLKADRGPKRIRVEP